jgi:two-component system, LytTR family, response regulator
MVNAIIIDDEERGINALQQLILKYCSGLNVAAVAMNIHDGADLINEHKPDVVFLDIEMPGGNGFQLLEKFDKINFEIIFVTAYNDYAIKALRFSALDYLLKPVKIEELQNAVERLKNKQSFNQNKIQHLKSSLADGNPFNKIVLSTTGGYCFVKIADIIYCEADENYTHFYLKDNIKHTASKPLKEYEELFERHNFYRTHKSYLVNLNQIEFVNKDSWVIMSNRKEVPISFRKRAEFFQLIKDVDTGSSS